MSASAGALPVINRLTHEDHFVKGSELIEQGHYEGPDGKKVDKEKMYKQAMPVLITRNHEQGIARAFARGGKSGVTNYIKRMRQIVEAN